jgi:phenylpyruvate tautomerase
LNGPLNSKLKTQNLELTVCYIEIKSVGTMGGTKTKAMSADFCAKVETALGVPKNRTYIEFADAAGAMWGWNGSTFG